MTISLSLAEFLQSKNADLPEIVAAVQSSVGLESRDVLLAVGSLVEGLGNRKSDLDLILITARDTNLLPANEVAVVVKKCLSDLQILPVGKLNKLLTQFNEWSLLPWDLTYAPNLTLENRRLLHRLLNSVALFEGHDSDLSSLLPNRELLARLKLLVARYMARTIQIDMAGNRETEDYLTLVFAAQELLGHAVDALAAGYSFTNPTAKWRSRILERLPVDWDGNLRMRPTGKKASEVFWSLHQTPEKLDKVSALEYAYRISTFARAVFVWAERVLVKQIASPHALVRWPSPGNVTRDSPLPHLDLDVDFSEYDGGVAIGRLNEFEDPVVLTPFEFEVALLFDGVTTAIEAKHAVCGVDVTETESRAVDQTITRLLHARLCAPRQEN